MRQRIVQILLAVLLIAFVVEILIIVPRKIGQTERISEQEAEVSQEAMLEPRIEQMIRGFHLVETQNGEKEWQLEAEKAFSIKVKEPTLLLEKVEVTFFGEQGVFFKVRGKKGNVNVNSKDIRVEGDVVITSSNGYVFETDQVLYDSQERLLEAPGAVDMQGPDQGNGERLMLVGVGMKAYLNEANIQVQSNVRAEKSIKDGRRLKISSEKADFSGKSNYARFHGNVVMDVATLRITGPQALFQYDSGAKTLRSVEVEGGVRVSDVDKLATSDRLSVDFLEDKFIFRGRPKIVQNQDELFGDQIVFLDGGKKVKVLGARARVERDNLPKAN